VTADRIVLIGFMGSGKTTVGRILAERLGWELVDTDARVEELAGAPISRIFGEQGEEAFRGMEARVLEECGARRRVVVATGGGAPAEARNRSFFSSGTVFYLRTSLGAARERTRGDDRRPLLRKEADTVQHLFEVREPLYGALGDAVDTDGRTPLQVAEEILGRLRNPSRSRRTGDSA